MVPFGTEIKLWGPDDAGDSPGLDGGRPALCNAVWLWPNHCLSSVPEFPHLQTEKVGLGNILLLFILT